jgi:signal transduction histidine kinase
VSRAAARRVSPRIAAARAPMPPEDHVPAAARRQPGSGRAEESAAYTPPVARNDGAPPPATQPAEAQMRMIAAQEAERARLARELHDGPTQVLANAVFQVEIIERLLDRDGGQARRELKALREALDRELKAMRGYLNRLRPPVLEDLGLSGAIREQAGQLEAMPGIPVTVRLDDGLDELPESVELVIYRVAQEALQNIRKHALARSASIRATRLARAWKVEVKDDGRGFDPSEARAPGTKSFGLAFMQERADMIGARFEVRSRRGGGTVVTLTIPWAAKENR